MCVTDRLLLSEITAQPPKSYSHHKISFFPSLSLFPTNSLSLSVHTLFALFPSLCVSLTHRHFLSLSIALSFLQLWPCGPSASSFSALLSESSQEARHRCQETYSARSAVDRTTMTAAKAEFGIQGPNPVKRWLKSSRSQRGSIGSQLVSQTRTKPTRPPQRAHRGQDTFSVSTVQSGSSQTRPHEPRHSQIITSRFRGGQTKTRPLKDRRGNLEPPTTAVCNIQH